MRRKIVSCGGLVVLWFAVACGGSDGPTGPAVPYVTDGPVTAIAVGSDGTTYIGGSFTSVGPVTGSGVPVDTVSGRPVASFPVVNDEVAAVAADGAGGWYIGGWFDRVGEVARAHLAHILANGTVDPAWAPEPDSAVNALAVANGVVYAGGRSPLSAV